MRVTNCLFENSNWTGHAHCSTGWNWVTWWGFNDSASLARARHDDEMIIALRDQIDTSDNRSVIDNELPDRVDRTSGLRAGMVNYGVVEYVGPDHLPPWQTLVDISFDFEVSIPPRCFGRNPIGTIHYYVLVTLDDGDLRADVDGWEHNFDRGGLCADEVDNQLDSRVPDGMSVLQGQIDDQLDPARLLDFHDLYFLPGDGEYEGGVFVPNVRHDAALILRRQ